MKLLRPAAIAALLFVCGVFGIRADAPPAPTITFAPANGATIRTAGLVTLTMQAASPVGLKSVSFAGANRAATCFFSPGVHQSTTKLYWNTTGYVNKDYSFRATATDAAGHTAVRTLTIRLAK